MLIILELESQLNLNFLVSIVCVFIFVSEAKGRNKLLVVHERPISPFLCVNHIQAIQE